MYIQYCTCIENEKIFDFEYALNRVFEVDSSLFGVFLGRGPGPDPRNAPNKELSKFLRSVEQYIFRELVGRVISAMSVRIIRKLQYLYSIG